MDPLKDILTDLPTIQRIAGRPQAQNPLLALILQQAEALAEIAGWAVAAQQSVQQPPVAAPEPTNDGAPTDMALARNGKRA